MSENGLGEIIGRAAAVLAVVEAGLGSVLHAWHVPFAGNALSANQSYLLGRLMNRVRRSTESQHAASAPAVASGAAAVLKSFSPVGKKLTPMLAISAQGSLFSLGVALAGVNRFGVSLGAALSGLWTVLQPLLVMLLVFGALGAETLGKMKNFYFARPSFSTESWLIALGGFALLQISMSVAAAWMGFGGREFALQGRLETLGEMTLLARVGNPGLGAFEGAWRDLSTPWFWLPLALTALFLFFVESTFARAIWLLLRPLGSAFLIFYLVRRLPMDRWLGRLDREAPRGSRRALFARACRVASERLRGSGA